MICQNCHAQVDDDLIFCTNCGERLFSTNAQTVQLNDSVVTQTPIAMPQKSSSKLKWIALIAALIAIPVSIFGVYLLTNKSRNLQITQNVNKAATPVQTQRKNNANQNSNANFPNINTETNSENTNSMNANLSTPNSKTEVMNERIEIAPKSHYARPFKIEADTAKLVGTVELLQGETYKGYVYLQSQYDEHFPDETYKMFIFGEEKKSEINSTLVKEDYVLIFVNEGEKPIVIQGNFWIE